MSAQDEIAYRSHVCAVAIDYMSKGHGSVAFAGNVGVSHATLQTWTKDHPEFARALGIGRAKAVMFWEQKLADIARSGIGNASAAIFGLKNAAAEWTAAQAEEAPRQTMSDLELARRIARILELGRQAEAKEEAKAEAKSAKAEPEAENAKPQAQAEHAPPAAPSTPVFEPQAQDG
ncbi:MAG: hypothetical protein K8F62_13445 [Pseudorhodoplanes sp.]|nr:hypothetical protein [Pseudorhodoplanes sp.]